MKTKTPFEKLPRKRGLYFECRGCRITYSKKNYYRKIRDDQYRQIAYLCTKCHKAMCVYGISNITTWHTFYIYLEHEFGRYRFYENGKPFWCSEKKYPKHVVAFKDLPSQKFKQTVSELTKEFHESD